LFLSHDRSPCSLTRQLDHLRPRLRLAPYFVEMQKLFRFVHISEMGALA
jgi:hypothetical protein